MSSITPHAVDQNRPATPAAWTMELFRNSRSQIPTAKFYSTFLDGLIALLRASAACVWRSHADGYQLVSQQNTESWDLRPEAESWKGHQQLLMAVVNGKQPARVRPRESLGTAINPFQAIILCVPITARNGTQFIVEVFCELESEAKDRQPKARLTRLNQLCEFFKDYIRGQELSQLASKAEIEGSLRTFLTRAIACKTFRELAVVIVNEGRQAIGGERVSLGWLVRGKPTIVAISGQETVDQRSNAVRALVVLTQSATKSALPLKTTFPQNEEGSIDSPPPDESVPEVYQSALNHYPTTERPRTLLVIPMGESREPEQQRGALIVEQFESESMSNAMIQKAGFVADQARIGLTKLEFLDSIPLARWWASTTPKKWQWRSWRLLLIATILVALGVAAFYPVDLRLTAEGELLAQTRHTIFAPENGIVRELKVTHASNVQAGSLLLTLENLELNAQFRELSGQLIQLRERQRSLEARRSTVRMNDRDLVELQSSLAESASSVEHTERQVKLLQQRLDQLQITAPTDGVITSWNVEQSLLNRPVVQGDALLQEIDPKGPWIVELQIPENRVGYAVRHRSSQNSDEKFKVEFVLATEPERRYSGILKSIATRTELTGAGHIVRASVELDSSSLPPLRDGAEVKARLHCGRQIAGFVWFRELIEVIQTYWWY